MLIFGLISSAGVSLSIGLVQNWNAVYYLAFLTGFVASIGAPAASAMLTDILPAEKRTDGFGILRVAVNLAVTIGPAIGGVLAGVSYLLLFIIDCVVSIAAAGIVYLALPETKPENPEGSIELSVMESLGGYWDVFKDRLFTNFIVLAFFTAVVYFQVTSTLSVYLNSHYGTSPQAFGYILSLNAVLVVLFQFLVTIQVKKHRPLWMMALGNVLYAVGISMYGFVKAYPLFLLAMVVFTFGEMVIAPVVQTLVANIAPLDMRGRYMAAFQLGYSAASAVGPLAAGVVMDNFNPHWVWYAGGIICCLVAGCYLILHKRSGRQFEAISSQVK
jgi:MFS family permease